MGATDGQDYGQANRLKYKADENLWEALYALNRAMTDPAMAEHVVSIEHARNTTWTILQTRNPALQD